MKSFTRYEIYENGEIKKVEVSREKAEKQIDRILKRDKELLKILEKL